MEKKMTEGIEKQMTDIGERIASSLKQNVLKNLDLLVKAFPEYELDKLPQYNEIVDAVNRYADSIKVRVEKRLREK